MLVFFDGCLNWISHLGICCSGGPPSICTLSCVRLYTVKLFYDMWVLTKKHYPSPSSGHISIVYSAKLQAVCHDIFKTLQFYIFSSRLRNRKNMIDKLGSLCQYTNINNTPQPKHIWWKICAVTLLRRQHSTIHLCAKFLTR